MVWPRAYSNYMETLNGYMSLAKITTDDPNFQNYVKSQMNYLISKAETSKQKAQSLMTDQKVAGYVTRQDRPDFVNSYNVLAGKAG